MSHHRTWVLCRCMTVVYPYTSAIQLQIHTNTHGSSSKSDKKKWAGFGFARVCSHYKGGHCTAFPYSFNRRREERIRIHLCDPAAREEWKNDIYSSLRDGEKKRCRINSQIFIILYGNGDCRLQNIFRRTHILHLLDVAIPHSNIYMKLLLIVMKLEILHQTNCTVSPYHIYKQIEFCYHNKHSPAQLRLKHPKI